VWSVLANLNTLSEEEREVKIAALKRQKDTHDAKNRDFEKHAMQEREDAAIRQIVKSAGNDEGDLHFIVYGDAHDFTRAVTAYNKNASVKIGLLKLSDDVQLEGIK
jgi:hypothetical protein